MGFLSTGIDLRKESRRLENEIDLKLVSFSKLGSTYAHRDDRFVNNFTFLRNEQLEHSQFKQQMSQVLLDLF